ncbi:LLM class flavin-dependent oxidoreductase [Paenibacillus roseus]|uniref:LLM class flavin-dependent oxidoreductase n=1 Tax=Paenibacillus roseus TaxID=2798579 RepID=A0A934IZW1_9BACL|nr:LLM class flavin-dependent oxidoreductase [Paenibacillus roseus]
MAALAGATSRIGLVATASTSYIEPFNLARLLMSVDHISKGRAGWNIVTTRDLSGNPTRNFGAEEHLEHSFPDFQKHHPVIVRDNPTLRELYSMLTGAFSRDELVGTPDKIANTLERWFREEATDGFMLMAPSLPDGLEDFVDLVVPILQSRGLVRSEYEGDTFIQRA